MKGLQFRILAFTDTLALFVETIARLPSLRHRVPETLAAVAQIGVGSLPIILVCTAFAGLVTTGEIAWHMDRALHTVEMIPGFSAQFILRELAVAVPSFLLVAKVGAAITAEVGTMKVTEQIDALKLLKIDPIEYLVLPRFAASILAGACLTLVASLVTLACALWVAVLRYRFMSLEYLTAVRSFLGLEDVVCALLKGMTYGGIIPVIACSYGFRCRGGAEGVGDATTNSVVAATVTIIGLDFVLSWVFSVVIG